MPSPALYYVATGYVEPGYFVSEPAPPELIKKEYLTVYEQIDVLALFSEIDANVIYRAANENIVHRPINRTTAYVSITEV
jgi:hypothetical protein